MLESKNINVDTKNKTSRTVHIDKEAFAGRTRIKD